MNSLSLQPQLNKLSRYVLRCVRSAMRELSVQVFLVGGALRDTVLQREIADLDFVLFGDSESFISGLISRLKKAAKKEIPEFNTVFIYYKEMQVEFITIPSVQKKYSGKNLPEEILADLRRRDFTINTLLQEVTLNGFGKLHDMYCGKKHIEEEVVKTPVSPDETIKDDPVRMLRAFRFAAEFNFSIDRQTYEAIANNAEEIRRISRERIRDELTKSLSGIWPSRVFSLMSVSGVLKEILPEIHNLSGVEEMQGYSHKDVFQHTLKVLENVCQVTSDLEIRMAALLHDIAKPPTKRFVAGSGWTFHGHDDLGMRMTDKILKRLKYPAKFVENVKLLVSLHLRPINLSMEGVTDSAIRRLTVQAGDMFDSLMILCRADITSGNPARVKKHLKNFDYVEQRVHEVREKDKLASFRSPLDGNEIMQLLGIGPGPEIGRIKKAIENAILDGQIPNDHDSALEYFRKIKEQLD